MKFLLLTATALTLLACTGTQQKVDIQPKDGEVITVGQACEKLEASKEFYDNVRFKSLPGALGVSRKEAEQLVNFWSRYCDEETYALYKGATQ